MEIRDAFRGALVKTIPSDGIRVHEVVWSGDGAMIAVPTAMDLHGLYEARIHRVSDGARLAKLDRAPTFLAWGVPGAPLVTGTYLGARVEIWDGAAGKMTGDIGWLDETSGSSTSFGGEPDLGSPVADDLGPRGSQSRRAPRGPCAPDLERSQGDVRHPGIDGGMEHVDLHDDLTGARLGTFAWKKAVSSPRAPTTTSTAPPRPRSLLFSPPGDRLAVLGDGRVDLRDAASGQLQRTIQVQKYLSAMAWSRDGTALVTLGTERPPSYTLATWGRGHRRATPHGALRVHPGSLAAAPDLAWVVVSGQTTRIVDMAKGAVVAELPVNGAEGIASDEGRHGDRDLASPRRRPGRDLVRPPGAEGLGKLAVRDVFDVSVSPDGRTVGVVRTVGSCSWTRPPARAARRRDGRRPHQQARVARGWTGGGGGEPAAPPPALRRRHALGRRLQRAGRVDVRGRMERAGGGRRAAPLPDRRVARTGEDGGRRGRWIPRAARRSPGGVPRREGGERRARRSAPGTRGSVLRPW